MEFAALERAVRRLASGLRALGVERDDVIALAAERSPDTIALILAVLHCGAAYLPLDLGYPPPRLAAMLEDARPRLVLGDEAARARLPEAIPWCPRARLEEAARAAPETAVGAAPAAPELAYVLFTSGSTGRPKGVAMRAAAVLGLLRWHAAHPRLGQPARTLQFAPLSFDVSFQEILSTLSTGGTLVLPTEAERRDPYALLALLERERVERLFVPYVALSALAEAVAAGGGVDRVPRSLRDVITAGEQLRITPAIRALFQALPGCALHNHYGPTETHVVTAHELGPDPATWPDLPPIGRALPHVRLLLLDAAGAPAPVGEEGELLIGGDCLAQGYIHRPELTRERFVERDGERWYRSGDRVRELPGGELDYLGRVDEQLKLDGYRIEPAEIEAALSRHPGVAEVAVVAADGEMGKRLVAHVVPRAPSGGRESDAALGEALRAHAIAQLAPYLVPQAFDLHAALPLTPSGKIDRRALARQNAEAPLDWPEGAPLAEQLAVLFQRLLGLGAIDPRANLFDLGARSLTVVRALTALRKRGFSRLRAADIYEHPTIERLAEAMGATSPGTAAAREPARRAEGQGKRRAESGAPSAVAIVGMAGRFPGADSVDALWDNLLAGRESITRFSPEELSPEVPAELRAHPRYVPARGVIAAADRFDAAFFGVPPLEARLLDPQQRVLLELCWNALEHAGIDPGRYEGAIGVYAGSSNNGYRKLVDGRPELVRAAGEFAVMLANEKDYVATRVAHRLDLRGPALSLHTACSTSLVAVAEAFHALQRGQCDAALAGGINIVVPQASGYVPVEGGMEAEDGHCRPFDAQASGTVFSSGGGVVVLKRLEDALADGDTIYAVIRGVGVNNDGADKASFTAPSVRGQAAAVRLALSSAGVSAASVGYVEAHGTGTALGDPIEVEALTRAFREDTADRQICWLGSAKSNFGHLVAAAGVTGLIKAALALHRGVIPETLHYRAPNPEIDFAATPFRVADRRVDWPRGEAKRRAGVSSFGVGGTNAHVVLEEAPPAPPPSPGRAAVLLPLSARDDAALGRRAAALAAALEGQSDASLPDIGYTLALGRKEMAARGYVVARTAAEARARLGKLEARSVPRSVGPLPRLCFLFSGQGAQHPQMARALAQDEPIFRAAFERACELASARLGRDLRAMILPEAGAEQIAAAALAETRFTQPALFAVEYALAELWEAWGLRPIAMVGHSVGEYVAACRAGVFSLEDAISLVVARGAAMHAQPPGAMLSVRADVASLEGRLPASVEVAVLNAPEVTVLSGAAEAIDEVAAALEADGIGSTRLKVSHAFHSALMEGALPALRRAFEGVRLSPPERVFYSCVSGAPITAAEATSPDYWCRQLRAPVRFVDAIRDLRAAGPMLFLEVGPGQALTGQVRAMLDGEGRAVASLGPAGKPGAADEHLAAALGEVWSAGLTLDWARIFEGQHRARVPLPGYPFQGERYWIDGVAAAPPPLAVEAPAPPVPAPSAPAQPAAAPPAVAPPAREPRLRAELRELFENLSGERLSPESDGANFLEIGLDSLSLTQAALELERRYGIKLKFRRLMEDLDTIERLAALLDQTLPREAPVAMPAAAPAPAGLTSPLAPAAASGHGAVIDQLIQSQMALMNQQMQLLAALRGGSLPHAASAPPADAAPAEEAPQANLKERPFGASARITVRAAREFTEAQRAWVDEFIRRYTARTARSKSFSQHNRKVMADPRVVTGFNPLWKELVYPIVVDRSKGARLWDVDGNEYIDLLNGFGSNFLGYQPDFVVEAVCAQMRAGIEVGPQHPLSADVARLISEMTGMERVAFCNTGSEAVMGAMRVARTVTGRRTIAIFTNSYHGIFDEVIVRGTRTLRSIAAAPGILASAVENVLVLEYGADESLRVLRERGHELAAVMIEPVQSRNPSLQPRAFVHELRKICDESGCALIFDEVITGFRISPGGAQSFYGVRADLATYGKIIGGGLPFAAIAGSARWMDALDGGNWSFGDDSYPEAGVTYFAGTFVRHPLALAAAKAALDHLKERGPALQQELNARTHALVERLNRFFEALGAPLRGVCFSSLWRIIVDEDQPFASLFYYRLRELGLHLYEQFGYFLTAAHGPAEVTAIAERVERAVSELMDAGLLVPRVLAGAAGDPRAPAGTEALDRPIDDRPHAAEPAALPDEVPLTDAQLEKWLACQYGPEASVAFNESFQLGLEGTLNRVALERALACVAARHEAFTLSFAKDGSSQRVGAVEPIELGFTDLAGPSAEAQLALHGNEAVRRPFDLGRAPLARFELLRLAPERHVLLVVAHHLVFDGWSAAVFLDELCTAYRAFAAGEAPALPAAESYRAYVLGERARRAGGEAARQLEYWKRVYATLPEALNLPTDRPRPSGPSFVASTERHEFSPELTAALRQAARREGITLYSLLLAAFGALLSRLSRQGDFAVGIPFAGQALAGSRALIGDGVNTLPIRLSIDAEASFAALAAATHRTVLDAAEHQDLTLHTLLRSLDLSRRSERGPLTEIIFNMNPRVPELDFTGLRHSLRDTTKAALVWDLFFNLSDAGKTLTLDLHYSAALFDASTIRRWIGHAEVLLAAVARGAAAPVGALPLFDAAERARVLQGWNATARGYDRKASLPDLFAAQAARTPSRIAAACEAERLTYAALERQASAVARLLIARGTGRGELVGVSMPRGLPMLVAVLGVLRSGAAYVPLDPAFPAERLRFMADHARIRQVLVLAEEGAPEAIKQGRALLPLAGLDPDAAPAASLPQVRGDDLAYVLYTSGSTGEPKGVRVLHRNLVNFLSSMREAPGIDADDVLCAVTTLSFDIAALELYLPLTAGARVLIATEEQHRDPDALIRLLRERAATMLQTTPSLLRLLAQGERLDALRGLRLLVGGEALSRDLADAVASRCKEVWNLFGPTETTVWSTIARVTPGDGPVSIGRPIANTRIYVLDALRAPAPEGVLGEIWIGGEGVADGYLHRPDLTEERFLPDPFAEGGGRMYRTGDIGALRDGELFFHGRADHQLKLRGYRIEPGDIEAAALFDPAVKEAVAVARSFGEGDARLVLYVAARGERDAVAALLLERLRKQLPPYMLPQYIEVLEALPKTPNGKLDRKALPAPAALASAAKAAALPVPPRDGLERLFAALFCELLKVREVSVHDNFFDIGGDSLLAVRLFQRAQEATGVNLPLSTLLVAPTVAGQARAFRDAGARDPEARARLARARSDPWAPLVVIQPEGSRPPFFCVHGMGGNVLNYVPLARAVGTDQPFYGLQSLGLDGVRAPLDSLPEMAARYREEIRALCPRGPYYLGGGSMGGMIAFEIAQQLRAEGEEVALLALFDTYGPGNRFFELERAGSLERMSQKWRQMLTLGNDGRLRMLEGSVKSRLERASNAVNAAWHRARGEALPHALRYRLIERVNLRAYYRYHPRPYGGPITLFRAMEQPPELEGERTLGWEGIAQGVITVVDLPGSHDTLIEQPALVGLLREALVKAQGRS